MFGIPGKSPVTITPKAVSQIRRLMERDTRFGLKIGVAVLFHEGSTVLVVANALRLLAYKDRDA